MDEKFDIFIAYYGNRETGSEKTAESVYEGIQGKDIGLGHTINAYFHPVTNTYGRFEDTPMIVAKTPMLLMVVDKGIPRNHEGQIINRREDGSLSNLFEEVRAFHDYQFKKHGGECSAKLFISDDFGFKDAERLHPMFGGITALNDIGSTIKWIYYFYHSIYPERLYQKYKYMAEYKKDEFLEGRWVDEAENQWVNIRHQGIARTLILYYYWRIKKYNDVSVKMRLDTLCRQLSYEKPLEMSSEQLLDDMAKYL